MTARKSTARKAAPKKVASTPIPATQVAKIEKPSSGSIEGKGKAHSFRLFTAQEAMAAGWKVEVGGPLGRTTTFTRDNLRVVVTYSTQDYVRKAVGDITIEPGESRKYKRLTAQLVELASA